MGKIQVINGKSELPEFVIQQIQSFLSTNEAARTALLSKSWYSAWLTRPVLEFDQRVFTEDEFSEFANRTLQRYYESKMKIERFRLCINGLDNEFLANELIVKAMKLGATDLEIVDYDYVYYRYVLFFLPHGFLGSENLISLSLRGCKIGLGKAKCSKLKSLSLSTLYLKKGDPILDILSMCPLIEKLSFSKVHNFGIFTRNVLPPNPSIEFHNLKCLVLTEVYIDTSFFCDLSSKFPCLKDLSVSGCVGYEVIQISSSSLERISFAHDEVLKAEFDVPRIRKFRLSSPFLPILFFKKYSSEWEWECDISVKWVLRPGTSCFVRLRKFLSELTMAKVSLSICLGNFSGTKSDDYNIRSLPKPHSLENLKLSVYQGSILHCVLLDALVWSCRPKLITQYWFVPKSSEEANKELLDILCKTLVQQVNENGYIPNRKTCGLHDLKEVNVEIFEDSAREWRPLPWKTMLDTSATPENKREIRFKLKWG